VKAAEEPTNEEIIKNRKAKKITHPLPHLLERVGEGWPRYPGSHRRWTGWLTYREYNLIEHVIRFKSTDMNEIGTHMKLKQNSSERMYSSMIGVGIIKGAYESFRVTDLGMKAFYATDEFILDLDLGDL
jgi:hypothetical protein